MQTFNKLSRHVLFFLFLVLAIQSPAYAYEPFMPTPEFEKYVTMTRIYISVVTFFLILIVYSIHEYRTRQKTKKKYSIISLALYSILSCILMFACTFPAIDFYLPAIDPFMNITMSPPASIPDVVFTVFLTCSINFVSLGMYIFGRMILSKVFKRPIALISLLYFNPILLLGVIFCISRIYLLIFPFIGKPYLNFGM
jgi:hypothetical protein